MATMDSLFFEGQSKMIKKLLTQNFDDQQNHTHYIQTNHQNENNLNVDTKQFHHSYSIPRYSKYDQLDSKDQYSITNISKLIKIMSDKAVLLQDLIDSMIDLNLNIDILKNNKLSQDLIYLFKISIGTVDWQIRRRVQDFINFDKLLYKKVKNYTLLPDINLLICPNNHKPELIIKNLEYYLISISKHDEVCKTDCYLQFFEISDFDPTGSIKVKEIWLGKRSGGRFKYKNCYQSCLSKLQTWNQRYCIITNEGIMYAKNSRKPKNQIREMLLFDHNIEIQYGKPAFGQQWGILIQVASRKLFLKANDEFSFIDTIIAFYMAKSYSQYNSLNRYHSFAPEREKNICKWYIDGQNYFFDLYNCLHEALNEIFITDWWLSPDLYLTRPIDKDSKTIYEIFSELSNRNVKIYIILYRESTIALSMNSLYTKDKLMLNNKNIFILRHPKTTIPFLWSHHEKMLIIDQKVGFVGGLDLCYGRFDTQDHPLTDLSESGNYLFPKIDYCNSRIMDFSNVKNYEVSDLDRSQQVRMPWHDIHMMLIGDALKDMCRHFIQYWNFAKINIYDKEHEVAQLHPSNYGNKSQQRVGVRKTIQNFYYKVKQKINTKIGRHVDSKSDHDSQEMQQNQTELQRNSHDSDSNLTTNFQLYVDKQRFEQQSFQEKFIDKKSFNRDDSIGYEENKEENSHSYQIKVFKPVYSNRYSHNQSFTPIYKPPSFQDKQNKTFQRGVSIFNHEDNLDILIKLQQQQIKIQQEKPHDYYESENTSQSPQKYQTRQSNQSNKKKTLKNIISKKNVLQLHGNDNQIKGSCNCQMLRSASHWSLGLQPNGTEFSIQVAYTQLISKAKNYIYIENQFFISQTVENGNGIVKNLIALTLVDRIKEAARLKEKFKVIVVMPLLPGFSGEIYDSSSAVMKVQLHLEYLTISKGGQSIIEQLRKDSNISDPSQYIEFYGLRTHGLLNNTPQTEIIYVHSKLMIVDDNFAIMGSANINDRSMIGNRDSEIAILTEDLDKIPSEMGGQSVYVGSFSSTLRRALYQEHFGLSEQDSMDPLSEQTQEYIRQSTIKNTEIYREIFRCYPGKINIQLYKDDNIQKLDQVKDFQNQKNLDQYHNLKDQIIGNAVQFPLSFLCDENLSIKIHQKEYIVPDESFT